MEKAGLGSSPRQLVVGVQFTLAFECLKTTVVPRGLGLDLEFELQRLAGTFDLLICPFFVWLFVRFCLVF